MRHRCSFGSLWSENSGIGPYRIAFFAHLTLGGGARLGICPVERRPGPQHLQPLPFASLWSSANDPRRDGQI